MTIRAYIIPKDVNESLDDYFNRVTSLPIIFDVEGTRDISIHPNDGYVELDGSISGQTETTVRA